MDESSLRSLLFDVAQGTCPVEQAVLALKKLPFADLDFARVDHHRPLRQGMAEAIYGPGKSVSQCISIVLELLSEPGGPVLLTRADLDKCERVNAAVSDAGYPAAVVTDSDEFMTLAWRHQDHREGKVLIVTAGTADLRVANECRAVLESFGFSPRLLVDCGVAGIHRLISSLDQLESADVAIVIAGMEGALASVVGGLTSTPVVAVPTSVGYGSSFEGITALLAMLSSCAPGIVVVGIDNGYGAACATARFLQ